MKKKITLAIICVALSVTIALLGAASFRYISLKRNVADFVKKIESGDLSAFSVYSEKSSNRTVDIADLPEGIKNPYSYLDNQVNSSENEENIVASILKESKINYSVSFFTNEVEYVVLAPDMESYLKELDAEKITDEVSLKQNMVEYISSGDIKERKVNLKYYKQNGEWKADFTTNAFLDAFTGGMKSGYNALYEQMLAEYRGGLGE